MCTWEPGLGGAAHRGDLGGGPGGSVEERMAGPVPRGFLRGMLNAFVSRARVPQSRSRYSYK